MLFLKRPVLGLMLAMLSGAVVAANDVARDVNNLKPAALTLNEAVTVAVVRDAKLAQYLSQAQAARASAVAAGSLPDPKLSLGVMNVPTDSFELDAEPMTMVTLGISQQFAAGDSADLRELRGVQQTQSLEALAQAQRLNVIRAVRKLWFEIGFTQRALHDARASRDAVENLLDLLTARYASGAVDQQALLQVQLEAGNITEKILEYDVELQRLRAALARWVGPELAQQSLAGAGSDLPLPDTYPQLLKQLESHPLLAVQRASIDANRASVALAEEAYEPEWMVSLQYGIRQGNSPMSGMPNSDMVSAMVSMSLPFFTDDRQDKMLAAARSEVNAAQFGLKNQLRQLRAELKTAWAQWTRYQELETLYADELIPAAKARLAAARDAYTNNTGDIRLLIDAQLGVFKTQTNAARIARERAMAQAALLYLAGEKQ